MDKLLDATMDFLYRNEENMDEEQAEIVRYGLELFFLKVFFFAATIIIGILMGSFLESIIFTALLSGIRTMAGGFHANTRTQCFIMSMLTFACVLMILKLVAVYNIILIPLTVLAVISSIVIWKFAPIDTENKPLEDDEIAVFRKKARVMLVIEIFISVVAYCIGFVTVACSALLALIVTGILMSAELLNKRRR
jgi:accessory gene regulator B